MNESETRAEYIDPKLKASGWGEVEGSKVLREFHITEGKIQTGGFGGIEKISAQKGVCGGVIVLYTLVVNWLTIEKH